MIFVPERPASLNRRGPELHERCLKRLRFCRSVRDEFSNRTGKKRLTTGTKSLSRDSRHEPPFRAENMWARPESRFTGWCFRLDGVPASGATSSMFTSRVPQLCCWLSLLFLNVSSNALKVQSAESAPANARKPTNDDD